MIRLARKGIIKRTLTTDECEWLDENIPEGTTIYKYDGPTYGIVSPSGIAISIEPGKTPFLEVPQDAVDWLTS